MFTNIRRAIGQLKGTQKEDTVNMKEVTEQISTLLVNKANEEKVDLIEHTKANKIDTEICLRWVDLLHKMIKQIIHIYSMHLKGDIDMVGFESKNQKQNRKVEILH